MTSKYIIFTHFFLKKKSSNKISGPISAVQTAEEILKLFYNGILFVHDSK